MRQDEWTAQELSILRCNAQKHSATEIARMVGRTRKAIYQKAYELSIVITKRGAAHQSARHSDDTVREILHRYYVEGQAVREIAVALNIPYGTVCGFTSGNARAHLSREFVK